MRKESLVSSGIRTFSVFCSVKSLYWLWRTVLSAPCVALHSGWHSLTKKKRKKERKRTNNNTPLFLCSAIRTCTCNRQHKATTRVEVMLAQGRKIAVCLCQRNGARQEDVIENEQWQSHGRLSGEAIWLSWPWSGFLMEEVSDRFICAPRFRQWGGNITWSLTYVVKFLRKHVGSHRTGWKQQNSFCLWHFFPVFLIEFTVLSGNNTSTWRGKNIIVFVEIKWWAEIAAMERLLLAGQSSYLTVSGLGCYKMCTFLCDVLCCCAVCKFLFIIVQ